MSLGRPIVKLAPREGRCTAIVMDVGKTGVVRRRCKNHAKEGRDFCGLHLRAFNIPEVQPWTAK